MNEENVSQINYKQDTFFDDICNEAGIKSKQPKKASWAALVIERLVHKDQHSMPNFWAREGTIFKELLQKYPNKLFWEKFHVRFKVKSLLFYTGERGNMLLSEWYKLFELKLPVEEIPHPTTTGEKVGKDKTFKKKPNLKKLLS